MSYIIANLVRQLPAAISRLPLAGVGFFPTRIKNAIIRRRLAVVLADLERCKDEDILGLRNVGEESVVAMIGALRMLISVETLPAPTNLETTLSPVTCSPSLPLQLTNAEESEPESKTRDSAPLMVSRLSDALEIALAARRLSGARTAAICKMRLASPEGATLQECAEAFGVTRERIRQIVASSLLAVSKQPVGIAFQVRLDTLLKAYECVRVCDLGALDPWFSSVPADGLWILIEALYPGRGWTVNGLKLVSKRPRSLVEAALAATTRRLVNISNVDQARVALEAICQEEAIESGMPSLSSTLLAIGREQLAERRLTLANFVKDYVASYQGAVELAELCWAAQHRGFDVSDNVVRNAVAGIPNVYPLGNSTFAIIEAVYTSESEERNQAFALAEACIDSNTQRQFHAEELLDVILERLGPGARDAIGDVHRLAALLRARNNIRFLGRLTFVSNLAPADIERLELVPLAERVLREASHPLDVDELLSAMREYRGIGRYSVQAVLAGLNEIAPGVFWLQNDLVSYTSLEYQLLLEDVYAVISPGEALSVTEIRRRIAQRTGNHVLDLDAERMRRLIASDRRFTLGSGAVVTLQGVALRKNPFDVLDSSEFVQQEDQAS